jgi:Putative peptidoglycan binding domain
MPGDPDRVKDLLQLKEIWEDLGLTVRAMTGWRDRGRASGNTFEVLGCHHTGAAVEIDSVLRNGRPGVPGPLCNVALHKNGDVVLVASGRANHFGKATWPNNRSLGVEATGPQKTGVKFPNRAAYELLAVGFCRFRGDADPRKVVKSDVGIPVHLVAAHKEVAVFEDNPKRYGRKPDPAFEDTDKLMTGTLAHGFSVGGGGVRLIDTFRARVHARMTPAPPPFQTTLVLNATGPAVTAVQHNLNRFLTPAERIPENGRFDTRTRDVLIKWQRRRLIQESSVGKVGRGTWEMLHAPNFSQTLKLNSTGTAVKQLKVALNLFGNHLDTNNPLFDRQTEQVVKNWQEHRGQRLVDGTVDMLTWFWIHAPSGHPPELHPT